MQPDREQEEGDPDLRQQLYLVHVPDGRTEGVRTDEDAGGDVAEDQGQPEPPGHDAPQEGGHQDKRYVAGDPQVLALTLPPSESTAVRRWAGRRASYVPPTRSSEAWAREASSILPESILASSLRRSSPSMRSMRVIVRPSVSSFSTTTCVPASEAI